MVEKTNNLSSSSEPIPISNQPNYIAQQNQPDNENDSLTELLFDFLKRRWRFISGCTCVLIAAIVYWAWQKSPIYQGKFLLLLEKPNVNVAENQNQVDENTLQSNNSANASVDYSTEVRLLGSSNVLAPILQEISVQYPDIYQDIDLNDSNDLQITQVDQSKIIEVSFSDENAQKVEFVLDKISKQYVEEQLNPLANNIKESIKFIESQTSQLQTTVNGVENQLQNLREKHNLIDPRITAQELTQKLINTQEQYSQTQIQLEEARQIYNSLQKQLNLNPQKAMEIISLSESQRYQDLQKQIAEIDLELAKESAVFTDDSPIILNLKEKRENTVKLLEAEIAKFTDVSSLKNSNNSTNAILNGSGQIKTELTNELFNQERKVQQLETRQKQLEKSLNELTKQNAQMPGLIRQYNELQRKLNNSTDSLQRWLKTKEDLEVKEAQNRITWTLISPTQLQEISLLPLSRNNLIIIALGSLTFSTVMAFIIDRHDDSIYNLSQLKRLSFKPVLATIPKDKKHSFFSPVNTEQNFPSFAKVSNDQKKNDTTSTLSGLESFRHMYSNFHLLEMKDNVVSSVVISSVNSDAETTSISTNFAKAAANMGKKVLLIDSNVKNSQIHQLLGIENDEGLSDILTEKIDLFKAIKPLPKQKNLSVITSGDVNNNLHDLLFTSSLKKMSDKLVNCKLFDLIIYNTSPLLDLSGAKVLASHTDGVILIVKIGQNKGKKVKQVMEELNIAQIPLLGMVANGI